MKLINKFTIWYLSITLLTMPITCFITYHNIKRQIETAETERLKAVNNKMAGQVRQGIPLPAYLYGRPVDVQQMNTPPPTPSSMVLQTDTYNEDTKREETRLTATNYYRINGKTYRISSYNFALQPKEILIGMFYSILWKLAILLVFVAISGRIISRIIFGPFRKTLKTLQRFSLRQKRKVTLPKTTTKEFQELNVFLHKMTDKALEDYQSLKEFTENASHELQTPLAVIRSKLELLTESEDIQGREAQLIADMQSAIDKLTHINRSLILLARLENHEFDSSEQVSFCRLTKQAAVTFAELAEMKGMTLDITTESGIKVQMHPSLADILLGNLFSNAIRHNNENGHINVILTHTQLIVKNTGAPPCVPTEELFQRFKKSNQSSNSVGIGLAIVKQICDLNNFEINYTFDAGWHTVKINFPTMSPTSNLLQSNAVTLHSESQP